MITVEKTPLEGLAIITVPLFKDKRGFFIERYNETNFTKHGITAHFVQDNHSFSYPGVLRGLHAQLNPCQGKLVSVIRGRIWDVAVDLRRDSATFGQHYALALSAETPRFFWIPAGFAHGFCVVGEEPAEVIYKVDSLYNPKGEIGIRWDDPTLALPWPVTQPIVSEKDEALPFFADIKNSLPTTNEWK